MKTKRFISAWFGSGLFMFILSYVWHGVLLNDFVNLKYPLTIYLGLAALVYLLIGFVLTYMYQYMYVKKLRYKGFSLGAILGFLLYLIAFVLGVSFNQGSLSYVVVDFIWQMAEQGVGGALIGFIFSLYAEMEKLAKVDQ